MKKLFLILLLLPNFAFAQNSVTVEKPVLCDWVTTVFEHLKETYKEEPIWLGKDNKSQYTVFVNPENGNFTILQFNNEIACILGLGRDSVIIPQKSPL